MTKKLYLVRLDYRARLANGRATSLSQYGDVSAIDAEAAILDALRVFREEREKRPHVVEVWELKADVILASDVERQALEVLLAEPAEIESVERREYCPECGYGPCGFDSQDQSKYRCFECGEVFTPAEALTRAEAICLYPNRESEE